ncbi:MAG: response regulator [Planctomycetes bacterium]|nr:response regulator [Planctomycetota bacterium]
MRRKSLSTGDLARYCQVTPATIVNWIRAGKLDVYTTPGGQYRMELPKFIAFLEDNEFPIPEELQADRTRKILIVDDEEEILDLLVEVVEGSDANYIVRSEKNGYDALIAIGDFKPDIVSIDLNMPKMDGAELVRRLRSNPETKNAKILIVTGMIPTSDLVRKVKRIGVDSFMQKPIDIDEYAKALDKLATFKV